MYISFTLGLIANAKQRKCLVEYRLNIIEIDSRENSESWRRKIVSVHMNRTQCTCGRMASDPNWNRQLR